MLNLAAMHACMNWGLSCPVLPTSQKATGVSESDMSHVCVCTVACDESRTTRAGYYVTSQVCPA
jgi:hypothetical protein